jgi:NAD-dependent dihydropyrimidine dehydrogenase PreA subunit/bacterioferritin-associated ferredoxin
MERLKILFQAEVDDGACNGDRICDNVCPTGAIHFVNKKARVDPDKCVACLKCIDVCPESAVTLTPRSEPWVVGTDPSSVDQDQLAELCAKANLDPEQTVCLCNGIPAKEVAAAVLKGAESPEDVVLMTGVRVDCSMWCTTPVLRLLKANGIEVESAKGYRMYDIEPTVWDIPEEVAKNYPEYFLEEDADLFRQGTLETFASVIVGRRKE